MAAVATICGSAGPLIVFVPFGQVLLGHCHTKVPRTTCGSWEIAITSELRTMDLQASSMEDTSLPRIRGDDRIDHVANWARSSVKVMPPLQTNDPVSRI